IRVTCRFDNSPGAQPIVKGQRLAPRYVLWGEGTTDEMCLGLLQVANAFCAHGSTAVKSPANHSERARRGTSQVSGETLEQASLPYSWDEIFSLMQARGQASRPDARSRSRRARSSGVSSSGVRY